MTDVVSCQQLTYLINVCLRETCFESVMMCSTCGRRPRIAANSSLASTLACYSEKIEVVLFTKK